MGPFNSKCVPPPHPPRPLPHAPRSHDIHLGFCDICSGHCGAVFSLPWQPVERARPLAASGEEKKRPAVSGVVCLVPACHCFQSAAGLATLTEHGAAGRGPQGPPATAVDIAGGMGAPEVNVISFSLKCEVCEGQKQRPSRRVGCLFLHLELL